MTDTITMDDLQGFLEGLTGYKADAAQLDAFKVAMETWAAGMAAEQNPPGMMDAHLHELTALARHLLDGARMPDAPAEPLVTRKDLQALATVVAASRDDRLIQRRILEQFIEDLLQDKATRQDVTVAGRPDLGPVLARLEGLHGELGELRRAPHLEALIRTILATLPDNGLLEGKLETLTDDVRQLCEEVAQLRAEVKAVRAPAYVPLTTSLEAWSTPLVLPPAEFIEQQVPAGAGIPASDEPPHDNSFDGILAAIRMDQEARQAKLAGKDPKAKHVAKDRPGCFYNDDGTITCRACGIARAAGEFSKDKAAWTGRKSSCKSCQSIKKTAA